MPFFPNPFPFGVASQKILLLTYPFSCFRPTSEKIRNLGLLTGSVNLSIELDRELWNCPSTHARKGETRHAFLCFS